MHQHQSFDTHLNSKTMRIRQEVWRYHKG